jgi:RNA 3'-phosphate cyclase
MIAIDGSYGEGGGQVLRTSLSISALLGCELRLGNIRAGRAKPGLAPQHLASVRAAATVCSASVRGDEIGSQELEFRPGVVRGGRWRFAVGTAGAATLVLQTVLPALLFADEPSHVDIQGGTNVPWSPAQEYVAHVFLPALSQMGAQVAFECLMPGFYPRGGGRIEARVTPVARALRPLDWRARGQLRSLSAWSVAEARLPAHIVRRQMEAAREALGSAGLRTHEARPESHSPGTALTIAASFERGMAGFGALGARGKRAEDVGREAGEEAARFLARRASVDRHLADQLLLYAALAGGETRFVTEEVTEHLRTNAWVIQQFLDVEIAINEATGEVTGEGAGMPAGGARRW